MTNVQAVVIGAAVVLGLTLHGILTRPQAVATSTPKFEELRQILWQAHDFDVRDTV